MADQRNGGISWTDATWNPIRGCSRVNASCVHCYAERVAMRFSGRGMPYEGLVRVSKKDGKPLGWSGDVRLVPEHLADPLRWKRPRRVFVNSMSDLFHEQLPMETIARVFAVMALCPAHTFQILTKRPKRMRGLLCSELFWQDVDRAISTTPFGPHEPASQKSRIDRALDLLMEIVERRALPNAHLGVSVGCQSEADEMIPALLDTPAAARWVSQEPQHGPVVYRDEWLHIGRCRAVGPAPERFRCGMPAGHEGDDGHPHTALVPTGAPWFGRPALDWIVVGGESGPGARPFDLAWARSTIAQCKEAGTACFVKQMGSKPVGNFCDSCDGRGRVGEGRDWGGICEMCGGVPVQAVLSDRAGADPAEWPSDLRVREFPA